MGARPRGIARRGAFGLFLVGLAGCGGPLGPVREAGSARPTIRLAVGEILDGEEPAPLPAANFIDERRSAELARTVRQRLRARLVPSGGGPTARLDLEQAALTERLAPDRQGGMTGLVTREPTYAQEGTVAVRIRILERDGRELARARVAVQRSRALPAGSSVTRREDGARALAADLLDQLDDALEVAVRDNLGPWLVE
ncbi:MAG: hypothetical protein K6T74_03045 [Geminicoccaceae bacterium]|nr:hypothetical protein [Geminicoccaceae bacterium]